MLPSVLTKRPGATSSERVPAVFSLHFLVGAIGLERTRAIIADMDIAVLPDAAAKAPHSATSPSQCLLNLLIGVMVKPLQLGE